MNIKTKQNRELNQSFLDAFFLAADGGNFSVIANCIRISDSWGMTNELLNECKDKFGRVALHIAASAGNLPVVETLVNNNADVNIVDGDGNTALHFAILNSSQQNSTQIVDFLLKNNANVNAANLKGNTAMHLTEADSANGEKKAAIVALLLKSGANIVPQTNNVGIDKDDKHLDTALRGDHVEHSTSKVQLNEKMKHVQKLLNSRTSNIALDR